MGLKIEFEKRKENFKIKEFKSCKIYFWKTYQNFSLLFE